MPSEKARVTYSPLAHAERAQTSSSPSIDADENGSHDENQGFLGPYWGREPSFQRRTWHEQVKPLWFHLLLLVANICLFLVAVYANSRSSGNSQLGPHHGASIFRDSIHLEDRYFNVRSIYRSDGSLNKNKSTVAFSGPPRPELEEAWAKILSYQNFRVREDELGESKGQKSIIELSDSSGFYVTVAVQHALHCVQRLHHYLYKDHYYAGLSEDDTSVLKQHTEHCLDWLRQYVQCNADTTLIPIRWASSVPGPVSKDWGKHQCVAWEPIVDIMARRAFDPFEPGLLVHPYFGNPYANGTGAQTGAVVLGHGEGLIGGDHGPDV